MSANRRIEYSAAAARVLLRIDAATAKRIRLKVAQLAVKPEALANNLTTLKGGDGLKRLRIGDWRVISTESLVVLTVIRIAPRGSAYEERK